MIDKTVKSNRIARRRLLTHLSVGGLVAGAGHLPNEWVKPVVNHVLLPAHARASVCGLTIQNIAVPPGSGSFCSVTFEVRTVAGQATITSITNTPLGASDLGVVLPSLPGTATTSSGPSVQWGGVNLSVSALVCIPQTDVTFSIRYSCAGSAEVCEQSFVLSNIIAAA